MDSVLTNIINNIVNPAVNLIFALAVVYFVYGVFEFIRDSKDPAARGTGGQHILWGSIGLAIMVSVFGIIRLIQETIDSV